LNTLLLLLFFFTASGIATAQTTEARRGELPDPLSTLRNFLSSVDNGDSAGAVNNLLDRGQLESLFSREQVAHLSVIGAASLLSSSGQEITAFSTLESAYLPYSLPRKWRDDVRHAIGLMHYYGVGTPSDLTKGRSMFTAANIDNSLKIPSQSQIVLDKFKPIKITDSIIDAMPISNGALLVFFDSHPTPRVPYISLNGKRIKLDDDKGRHLVYIKPGIYELQAGSWPCFLRSPYQLNAIAGAVIEIDLKLVGEVLSSREQLFFKLCTTLPKITAIKSYFPSTSFDAFGRASSIHLFGFRHLSDLEFTSIESLKSTQLEHQREVVAIVQRLAVESRDRLQRDLVDLEATRDIERVKTERIRREGDGSIEDLACKKRGLKPSTPAYVRCYADLVSRKNQRGESARIQAEREANDPFADAKKRCTSIGLKPKTEAFGKCVLELTR
jgi:hypothetical protein